MEPTTFPDITVKQLFSFMEDQIFFCVNLINEKTGIEFDINNTSDVPISWFWSYYNMMKCMSRLNEDQKFRPI